jgi:hypothetical protein
MMDKLILDGSRVAFYRGGSIEVRPSKKKYTPEEVEALMAELRGEKDEPTGPEQGH